MDQMQANTAALVAAATIRICSAKWTTYRLLGSLRGSVADLVAAASPPAAEPSATVAVLIVTAFPGPPI